LIHSIWTSDEKVVESLLLGAIRAFSSKNKLQSSFSNSIFTISPLYYVSSLSCSLIFFLEQSHH